MTKPKNEIKSLDEMEKLSDEMLEYLKESQQNESQQQSGYKYDE